MRKRSKARAVNGIVSAVIVGVFAVHGILGAVSSVAPLPTSLAWLVWGGVALIAVHVVTSVVTSRQQLSDSDFPPSPRKKRHLALKWASGAVLLVLAAIHIACMLAFGPDSARGSIAVAFISTALAAALAVHICIGAKSLLTDLGLSKRYLRPVRIAVCVVVAIVGCAVMLGAFI